MLRHWRRLLLIIVCLGANTAYLTGCSDTSDANNAKVVTSSAGSGVTPLPGGPGDKNYERLRDKDEGR
jgi:hypothetical protein